jgi:hypothetical protein
MSAPVLVSASPDPTSTGAVLSVIGTDMDLVQALYVAGVSVPWTPVSSTRVDALISDPLIGLQEIYAEYV